MSKRTLYGIPFTATITISKLSPLSGRPKWRLQRENPAIVESSRYHGDEKLPEPPTEQRRRSQRRMQTTCFCESSRASVFSRPSIQSTFQLCLHRCARMRSRECGPLLGSNVQELDPAKDYIRLRGHPPRMFRLTVIRPGAACQSPN